MSKKSITLWMEGYAATGNFSKATCLGTYEAENLDQAVRQYAKEHPDAGIEWDRYGEGRHSIWACQIFDNEADAREGFG